MEGLTISTVSSSLFFFLCMTFQSRTPPLERVPLVSSPGSERSAQAADLLICGEASAVAVLPASQLCVCRAQRRVRGAGKRWLCVCGTVCSGQWSIIIFNSLFNQFACFMSDFAAACKTLIYEGIRLYEV